MFSFVNLSFFCFIIVYVELNCHYKIYFISNHIQFLYETKNKYLTNFILYILKYNNIYCNYA